MARVILFMDEHVDFGGAGEVIGTADGSEFVTLLRGQVVLDASFNQGGDTIILPGVASGYFGEVVGSRFIITRGDFSLSIPLGPNPLTIQWDDGSRELAIDAASDMVLLGYQLFEGDVEAIDAGPPAAQDDEAAIENGGTVSSVAGNVLDNDSDPDGGPLGVTAVNGEGSAVGTEVEGEHGILILEADGNYRYEADSAALAALGEGESVTDSFTYAVADGNGGTDEAVLTVTLSDGDAAPQVSGVIQVASFEDGPAGVVDALANVEDPEGGALDVIPPEELPAGVTFDVADDTFRLDPAHAGYQSLAGGEVDQVRIDYEVTDGNNNVAHQIVWIITGVNDAALFGGTRTGAVVEDGSATTSGQVSVRDPDHGQSGFDPASGGPRMGAYGNFAFDAATGQWDYDLDNGILAVQSLGAGDTVTDAFTVRAIDGTGQTVTISVKGTNDVATISGTSAGKVTEDGTLTFTGQLAVADVDAGESQLQAIAAGTAGANGYGTFEVGADGSWTYTLDNADPAVQALNDGETLTDTITVLSQDGSDSETVTVTINGADDAPVARPDLAQTDQNHAIVIDVIANDTASGVGNDLTLLPVTGPEGGSFSVDRNNNLVFEPLGDFDYLAEGDTEILVIDYTVEDENGRQASSTVTLTVTGTNDAPVAHDVTFQSNQNANPGFDDAFAYWVLNPFVSGAAGGVSIFTLGGTYLDGDPMAAVLEFRGPTSAPVGLGVVTGPTLISEPFSANEGETIRVTYQLDAGIDHVGGAGFLRNAVTNQTVATIFLEFPMAGSTGDQIFETTLAESGTFVFEFQLASADSDGDQSVGASLAIGFAGVLGNAADEDKPVTFQNAEQILLSHATDVDVGDILTVSDIEAESERGAIVTRNDDGSLSYDPNGRFEYLNEGESAFDTVEYTVSDGNGGISTATLTIEVKGADDLPVANPDTATTSENAPVEIDVLANDRAPGIGNDLILVSATSPQGGSISIEDNKLNFEPLDDFKHLGTGESKDIVIGYTIEDENGDQASSTVTVTVTGVNDAPDARDVTFQSNQVARARFDQGSTGWNPDVTLYGAAESFGSFSGIDADRSLASLEHIVLPAVIGEPTYGPTITSDPFQANSGETIRVTFELSSPGDFGMAAGYLRDAVTNEIVQTILDIRSPAAGSTGVVTVEMLVEKSGNYVLDFQAGTLGIEGPGQDPANQVRLLVSFAGVLGNAADEDVVIAFKNAEQILLSHATDVDDDTLVISQIDATSANGATVELLEDGSLLYDPTGQFDDLDEGQTAFDTIGYTVSDGNGGTDRAILRIEVIGHDEDQNAAPYLDRPEMAVSPSLGELSTSIFGDGFGPASFQVL